LYSAAHLEYSGAGKEAPAPVTSWALARLAKAREIRLMEAVRNIVFMERSLRLVGGEEAFPTDSRAAA
jgi:hypothetical protein